MEYERRFRLDALPPDLSAPTVLIRQVYWALGDGWVLRLRRTGDTHVLDDELALKGPRAGVGRFELEFALRDAKSRPGLGELARIADELYGAGRGQQVVKTRHSYLDASGET